MTETETTNNNLVWVDCEFTGLDYDRNTLVEIACVVTTSDLKILGTPVSVVIHHEQRILDELLSEWSRKHFGESGLIKEIAESTCSMSQAEAMVLEYITEYTFEGVSPLCGNSVSQDRRVLFKDMPRLEGWMHYRNIDVSSLKELARRWKPEVLDLFKKEETHRALDDIYESIDELKIYRTHFIKDK